MTLVDIDLKCKWDLIDLQWFAAEDEGRTEDPSETKLRKAREEGRLPKSSELNGALVFLFSLLTLFVLAKRILFNCAEVLVFFFNHINEKDVTNAAFAYIFAEKFIKLVVPVAVVGMLFGVIGNLVQNRGFIFSWKPIKMNFSKIVPKFGQYFKNTIFSLKGVFNIVKSIGKVIIIIFLAYFLIKKDIPVLLQEIQNKSFIVAVFKICNMAGTILIFAALIFLAISVPDYFVVRREFMESQKMTKYEQKQEYKEMEGDPEVQAKIKQRQYEMMRNNIPKAVKEADVVITNPTHFAVSLKYEANVHPAPMVTAKGEDQDALNMRRIATENNVPIVEHKAMARDLYTNVDIGGIIPEDYVPIMAQIYAEVYKYNSRK